MIMACKAYTGHTINKMEFDKDIKKISQISRFLTRYTNDYEINLRVLINVIITFFNVFDLEIGIKLVLFRIPSTLHNKFCTVLVFLNLLPVSIKNEYNLEVDKEFLLELEECL